ncbi:MAG: signal peptidase I [Oscillospiraceae bacterium]|nr:signal peptidase I [Oscillospiraceae bacterium]
MNETWPEIKKRKLKERRGETFDWIQSLVVSLLICVLLFTFVLRVINVSGTSMLDTLHDGDRILISNLFYTPRQGDVVVLQKESFSSEPIVKRIIALEGQTVNIDFDEGVVYVDGVALDEPYVYEPTHRRIDFEDEVVVPEGCLFVLGDNRNGSTDSRDDRIGFVDSRLVMGRAFFLLIPGSDPRIGESRDWGRIGWVRGWAK